MSSIGMKFKKLQKKNNIPSNWPSTGETGSGKGETKIFLRLALPGF